MSRTSILTALAGITLAIVVGTSAVAILGPSLTSAVLAAPPIQKVEIYPQHYQLKIGEPIHYTAVGRTLDGKQHFLEQLEAFEIESGDAKLLQRTDPSGLFLTRDAGEVDVVIRMASGREYRFPIQITDEPWDGLSLVDADEVAPIEAESVLLVVHANRDGFDHTGATAAGIDREIARAKRADYPAVYLASKQYPNWRTLDRSPDCAIHSEGGEHRLRIDTDTLIVTGGNFDWCVAAAADSALAHLLSNTDRKRIKIVLPTDAVYDQLRGASYPQPAATLEMLLEAEPDEEAAYRTVIVPFLEKLMSGEAVQSVPESRRDRYASARDEIANHTIEVEISSGFCKTFHRGDSGRTVRWKLDRP